MHIFNSGIPTHQLFLQRFLAVLIASALGFFTVTNTAIAGTADKKAVEAFYAFLSNGGSESHAAQFKKATSGDWESIGGYSGKSKSRDQLIGQMGGFAKLIPDLNWEIVEMIRSGNRIVVRSRATGTPTGPLFGVNGNGKSFDILSIDIHTIEGGKITRSYHVEDWAGALRQLKSQ